MSRRRHRWVEGRRKRRRRELLELSLTAYRNDPDLNPDRAVTEAGRMLGARFDDKRAVRATLRAKVADG